MAKVDNDMAMLWIFLAGIFNIICEKETTQKFSNIETSFLNYYENPGKYFIWKNI